MHVIARPAIEEAKRRHPKCEKGVVSFRDDSPATPHGFRTQRSLLPSGRPCVDSEYRLTAERWRSASSMGRGPKSLNRIWTTTLTNDAKYWETATGPILHDWRDNPVVRGPLSPPTIALCLGD